LKFLHNKTITDVAGAIIGVIIFWVAVQIFTDFNIDNTQTQEIKKESVDEKSNKN